MKIKIYTTYLRQIGRIGDMFGLRPGRLFAIGETEESGCKKSCESNRQRSEANVEVYRAAVDLGASRRCDKPEQQPPRLRNLRTAWRGCSRIDVAAQTAADLGPPRASGNSLNAERQRHAGNKGAKEKGPECSRCALYKRVATALPLVNAHSRYRPPNFQHFREHQRNSGPTSDERVCTSRAVQSLRRRIFSVPIGSSRRRDIGTPTIAGQSHRLESTFISGRRHLSRRCYAANVGRATRKVFANWQCG